MSGLVQPAHPDVINSADSGTASPNDEALLQLVRELLRHDYAFTSVTPLTHARVNQRSQNKWANDLPGIFGWSRPFHENVVPARIMALMHEANIVMPNGQGWISTVRISTLGSCAFIHSAYPTDAPDSVFFGPDSHRFTAAIRRHLATYTRPVQRVADIGCGAGPGAISIALRHPDAKVTALDINDQALRFTRLNASLASCGNITCSNSNLFSAVDGLFDLIVANPPYLVDSAQRTYRHGGGPLGGSLSLSIVDQALSRLVPGGCLLLYTGSAIVDGVDQFKTAVADILPKHMQWQYEEIDPDIFSEELLCEAYANAERIAAVVFTVIKQ